MEKKMIDRDALCRELVKLAHETDCNIAVLPDVAALIREAPAVDAVPVVRCKDCRYYVPETNLNLARCHRHGLHLGPDGYCCDGEAVDNE